MSGAVLERINSVSDADTIQYDVIRSPPYIASLYHVQAQTFSDRLWGARDPACRAARGHGACRGRRTGGGDDEEYGEKVGGRESGEMCRGLGEPIR